MIERRTFVQPSVAAINIGQGDALLNIAGNARRQDGLDRDVVARAWAAQLRLCGRFRRLDERKTNRNIVVTAIARELAGFVWAEMTA